ncbi:MAG: GNAT family N-acetyltransferase [Paracoccaceae bacterium]
MAFDRVIVADWSAANLPTSPVNRANAVWLGCHDAEGGAEWHHRTRASAEAQLATLIDTAAAAGQRLLIGFDFAFAFPAGLAARLTGAEDPRRLWAWLAAEIEDAPDNTNNRFAVATAINAAFPEGPGPFWSHPTGQSWPQIPPRRAGIDYAALGLAEHRAAETAAPSAKSPGCCSTRLGRLAVAAGAADDPPAVAPPRHRRLALDPIDTATVVLAESPLAAGRPRRDRGQPPPDHPRPGPGPAVVAGAVAAGRHRRHGRPACRPPEAALQAGSGRQRPRGPGPRPDMIRLTRGFTPEQRPAAARLYWEAFGGKLGPVLGPEPRALAFLNRVLREDHCFAASAADGTLLGIAGFKSPRGGFAGGGAEDMRAAYGRFGALWRSLLLWTLSHDVDNHRFLVDGIAVTRAARGRGIGSALVQALCDEGRARGYASIRLEVIDSNWRARAL